MTKVFELSSESFDEADFSEATLRLDLLCDLPETWSFLVWGMVVPPEFLAKEEKAYGVAENSGKDVYIAGWTRLNFTHLVGGEITVYPYLPEDSFHYCKDSYGNNLCFHKKWEAKRGVCNASLFLFESRITWPYGSCSLRLLGEGGVTARVETDRVISVSEYAYSPEKYSWSPPVSRN